MSVSVVEVLTEKLPNFVRFGRELIVRYQITEPKFAEQLAKIEANITYPMLILAFLKEAIQEEGITADNLAEHLRKDPNTAKMEAADFDKLFRYYQLFLRLCDM
jgi:hypothetical protein